MTWLKGCGKKGLYRIYFATANHRLHKGKNLCALIALKLPDKPWRKSFRPRELTPLAFSTGCKVVNTAGFAQ